MSDSPLVHRLRRLALGGLLAALFVGALASPAAALEQKLTAPDGGARDMLGKSVAVDGDTIVLGAPSDDGGRGSVYVFQRAGDVWTQVGKLTATDASSGDSLGSSVAIDGDTIVAGAPFADIGTSVDQGAVYTFARTGAPTRGETAKLTAGDGGAGDRLGFSVAIDGDTIVAGAPLATIGKSVDRGGVYTFARTGKLGANRDRQADRRATAASATSSASRSRSMATRSSPARSSPRSGRTSSRVRPTRLIGSAPPRAPRPPS